VFATVLLKATFDQFQFHHYGEHNMLGTIINVGAVSTGSLIGIALGNRLKENVRNMVFDCIGLMTLLIGFQMAFKTKNVLLILGSLLVGGIVGEYFDIEEKLRGISSKIQASFHMEDHSYFVDGFVTASVLFCVGPMAILGSIQDGLTGDFTILAIKSALDGFASIGLATAFGWGVFFSILSVALFQGSITCTASWLDRFMNDQMIAEMTAVGGLLIVAIGIRLLQIKDIKVANLLPALFFAPIAVRTISAIRHLIAN